ncbi:hypothetical protein RJ640_007372 [Escallonia rubra]|uniref:Uncharacterized protein n=1 Tax=Escallonia rubra TaxID=112253 RepID=A0AA88UPS6_9ASTE|nr:hypothetical protein RJ640_007372 [Escallonia rubra]
MQAVRSTMASMRRVWETRDWARSSSRTLRLTRSVRSEVDSTLDRTRRGGHGEVMEVRMMEVVGSGGVGGAVIIAVRPSFALSVNLLQDLHQPKTEASLPEGLLSVPLLRHQKIALQWMQQKEGSLKNTTCLGGILADDQGLGKTISMIALIQYQRSLESKPKPEDQCIQEAEALNLDDDDGGGTSVREIRSGRPSAGTLVVCPASILRQWARELEEKVADEAKLSVLVYHGGNRTKDPVELASHDVVLTTYSIVTNEVPKLPMVNEEDYDQKNGDYGLSSDFSSNKKRKQVPNASKSRKKGRKGVDNSAIDSDCGTLARVRWLRVILDEAQTIKNHRTQVARACCGLRAKKRWCLSGTPIQNAIDELFSYFRFLRYDPYTKYKSFYNTIKVPIAKDSNIGYMKLQAVLRGIMLRRTKEDNHRDIREEGSRLIPYRCCAVLTPGRWVKWTVCVTQAYAAAGTLNQNYANILLLLLRLRQACDHPLLVKGFSTDSVGRDSFKMAKNLPRDMLINLAKHLDTSFAICDVCSREQRLTDPPEDAVVTICGHVFCRQCVSELLTGDENTCPSPGCKEQLGANVVFSKATLRSCISDDLDGNSSISSESTDKSKVLQNEYTSSKIKAILEILESHCEPKSSSSERRDLASCNGALSDSESPSDRPTKAIIFSQWTGMLDLIEMSLNHSYLHHRRLDGTMTLSARDRAVKEFNTDPEVTVMLMSLKAGNLGLNMVAASHVILVDLWWNPTTEDQAIDRAHRIGQTRAVTVSRLTIKDTVEDRILSLQEEKRKIVASAFGEDPSGASAARLSVEDLRKLFGI